jgi:alpha-ketoglutarate-dependent taurine dioxygenase
VVFFRAQDDLTNDLQKKLILRLGELTGRPATSGLHIHPILNSERELGGSDPEISTISSVQHNKLYAKQELDELSLKKQSSAQWHSDIAFEPVPADYTSLRLVELPQTGGGKQLVAAQMPPSPSCLPINTTTQIHSGRPVMNSMTASANLIRDS